MPDPKLRRAIAVEAARLMYDRTETEYFTAKKKAAGRLCRGPVKPGDLPSNAEIRDVVQLDANCKKGAIIRRFLQYESLHNALHQLTLLILNYPNLNYVVVSLTANVYDIRSSAESLWRLGVGAVGVWR